MALDHFPGSQRHGGDRAEPDAGGVDHLMVVGADQDRDDDQSDVQGSAGGTAESATARGRSATPTSTTSSLGSRVVVLGPLHRSLTGSVRWPACPTTVSAASRQISNGVRSAAGEALHRLPPTVARVRVCGVHITRARPASARLA